MYCDCRKADTGFTAMHEKDERGRPIPETFNYDFWVRPCCMRPTRMVFEKLTKTYAPARAVALLSYHGTGDGRGFLRWATATPHEVIETMTFTTYPREMKMLHDQGRNVCLELWQRMDKHIDNIRGGKGPGGVGLQFMIGADAEFEKIRAQELADTISLIMAPFYESGTAVLQESMNRWTARQEGREHESPGLAERIWQPVAVAPSNGGAPRPAPRVKAQFDDAKKNFIVHCLNNGIQTPETLATMFSCEVADIKAVIDDAN